jgi:hypothetical protein
MLVPTVKPQTQKSANANNRAAVHIADLARLLPLWPHELDDMTSAGCEKRIGLLRKSLRAERRRGLAGHWTYDLGRHSALLRCYKREVDLARETGLAANGPAQSSGLMNSKAG